MKTPLPPDPENQNDDRASWAQQTLKQFARLTGVTGESSHTQVQDLLANLMHFADRTEGLDFDSALVWARMHYEDETAGGPEGDAEDAESEPFAAQYWATAAPAAPATTPLAEVLAALDGLLTATVDESLASGYGLTDAEYDARAAALAVFEKYGKPAGVPTIEK